MHTNFQHKTIIVTGHTGFKGSWLSAWLTHLGASVVGISNDVPTEPSNFNASEVCNLVDDHRVDVRDTKAIQSISF